MSIDVGCERGYRYDNFTYDRGNIIFCDNWFILDSNFKSNVNIYPGKFSDDVLKGIFNYD